MKISAMDRLRRVTDLFITGSTVYLGDDAGGPVCVWVAKPNAFARAEAQRDGVFARNRRLLTYTPDHPELAVVIGEAAAKTAQELAEMILARERYKFITGAQEEIRADPAWSEDLKVLDRADELIGDEAAAGREQSPAESAALAALNARYIDEVTAAEERLREAAGAELAMECPTKDELEVRYVESWKQVTSLDAFGEESRITEVYYALRECNATGSKGAWDHSGCEHERLLASRSQVRELEQGVMDPVVAALEELSMTPASAGNSDAPATSSASSGQHGEEEGSTPSTPAETSPQPAGT